MFKHLIEFNQFISENNTNGILNSVISIENIAKKHNIDIKKLQKYLEIGTKIEREHTDDNEIAKKITLKHLEENPMYYHQKFGLPEIEKRMKKIEQEKRLEKDIIDQQKINQEIIETNESIRDFLKPKSEEDILSGIENLSDIEKFEKSCKFGLTSVVKDLINNGFDPSYYNNYGLKIATQSGNLGVVKLLLKDERVDPSVTNNNIIFWASYNDHLSVVKELLKNKKVDPSDANNRAIFWASENGYLDIVKELLKDERVTDNLSKEKLEKYQKQVEGI